MTSLLTEDDLCEALRGVLLKDDATTNDIEGLDEDLVAYISGLLATQFAEDPTLSSFSGDDGDDSNKCDEMMEESMIPFLESVGCPTELIEEAKQMIISKVKEVATNVASSSIPISSSSNTTRKLQQGMVNMSSTLSEQSSENDDANRFLWSGTGGMGGAVVKANANTQIDAYSDKTSAKDKRKARQELEKARRDLAAQNASRDDDPSKKQTKAGVSSMLLPTIKSKEKDVQLLNITLSLDNGTLLMEHGDLKFTYQRRYGLIGENGVGKVRLLLPFALWIGVTIVCVKMGSSSRRIWCS